MSTSYEARVRPLEPSVGPSATSRTVGVGACPELRRTSRHTTRAAGGLATTVVAVVRQHAVSMRATGLTQPSLGAGSRRGLMRVFFGAASVRFGQVCRGDIQRK